MSVGASGLGWLALGSQALLAGGADGLSQTLLLRVQQLLGAKQLTQIIPTLQASFPKPPPPPCQLARKRPLASWQKHGHTLGSVL